MKYSELEKRLRKAGCRFEIHGTNHDWWFSPLTNRRFQLPRHRAAEVKSKTLKSISEQSGVRF